MSSYANATSGVNGHVKKDSGNASIAADDKAYDYIICGGGVSGLVLANRLSEDASKSVLLIEAGANRLDDDNINIPGLMGKLWGNPNYDWDFWSEPQPHLNNRIIAQPRGKVLGGSSAINFAAVLYPTKENFAAWTALGNRGWTAEDMAPYYRKFHTFYPATEETKQKLSLDTYMDEKAQGTEGPLPITIRESSGSFGSAWFETFKQLGFDDKKDPIAGEKLGAFTPPSSIDPKMNTRSYAASAYYTKNVAARPNFEVMTETLVEKVLLEKSVGTVTARGVQIKDSSKIRRTVFGNEVILSAGAIQSPQILELSGVGRKSILQEHGVPVILDAPGVGENFQDHPFAAVSFEVAEGQVSGDVMRDPHIVAALFKQYKETRQGPIGGSPMNAAFLPPVDRDGVMSTEAVERLVDTNLYPELSVEGASCAGDEDETRFNPCKPNQKAQYAVLRRHILDPKEATFQLTLMATQMHYKHKTSMADALSKPDPRNMVSILVTLNHPLSRGGVHIKSSDPKVYPIIDPKYLSHPLDMEIMARGVQYLDRLVTTSPLKELLKPESRIPDQPDLSSLETAKSVVRERLFTNFHPSSTCSMMPKELGGVVDDHMRVYGVNGLRVVDASIFPMMTQGNIQATVYAVAERAADIIKADSVSNKMTAS